MTVLIQNYNRFISLLVLFFFIIQNIVFSAIPCNNNDCLSPSSEFSPVKTGFDIKEKLPPIPYTEYRNENHKLTPFWAQIQIAASVFINSDKSLSFSDIKSQILNKLSEYNLNFDVSEKIIVDIIDYLNEKNLIAGNYKQGFKRKIHSNYLMVWADDYNTIKETIENIIKNTKDNESKREKDLQNLLTDFANACKTQKTTPNEANHPVLRAIAVLGNEERGILTKLLLDLKDKNPELFKSSLINALILRIDSELKKAFDKLDDEIKKMWEDLPEDSINDEIMENFQLKIDVLTQNLHKKFFGKNWMLLHASNVKGTIYEITPEGQDVAGGLGRVEQYHPVGMRDLGAKVAYVEPYYRYSKLYKGEQTDYTKNGNVAVKVKGIGKPYKTFSINVSTSDNPVEFNVFRGINERGIPVFLIRDVNNKYIRTMFDYKGDNPNQQEFSEFFTKAAWKFIEEEEQIKKVKQQDAWNKPVINCNDAQSLLLPLWRVIELLQLKKDILIEEDPVKRNDMEERFNFILKLVALATTHTYKNRDFIGPYSTYWKNIFNKMGIPESLHWLFIAQGYHGEMNLSSVGLRCSEIAKAVAGVHRDEVKEYDPNVDLIGISNGDDIKFSTRKLRELVEELYGKEKNPNDLSQDEIIKVKSRSKNDVKNSQMNFYESKLIAVNVEIKNIEDMQRGTEWNLDNIKKMEKLIENKKYYSELISAFNEFDINQKTFGYIGRFVSEKAGMERAFTESNIETLLINGTNVVIYGNVQPYIESEEISRKMKEIMYRLNAKGYKGKLIFKDAFSITEHIDLMPALDMQINDSDRHTGACEITETNAMANYAIQFSPPFVEGLIAKQGAPINYKAKTGNTVLPKDDSSLSYLNAMLNISNMNANELAIFQKNSNKLSEVLDAKLTASEYLILINEKIRSSEEWMLNFLKDIERPAWEVGITDVYTEIIRSDGVVETYLTDNIRPESSDEYLIKYYVNLNGVPLSQVNAELLLPKGDILKLTPISKNGQVAVFACRTKNYPGKSKFLLSSGIKNVILHDWGIFGGEKREAFDRPIFSYKVSESKEGNKTVKLKFFRAEHDSTMKYKLHLGISSIGNGWMFHEKLDKNFDMTFNEQDGTWETEIQIDKTLDLNVLTFVIEDKNGHFLNNFGRDFHMITSSNINIQSKDFQFYNESSTISHQHIAYTGEVLTAV